MYWADLGGFVPGVLGYARNVTIQDWIEASLMTRREVMGIDLLGMSEATWHPVIRHILASLR